MLNTSFLPLNSQRGQSTIYIVIVIMVIIFAVMLAGGGGSLFTGNIATSVTDTPTPGVGTGTPSESPSISPTTTWSVNFNLGSCITQNGDYFKKASVDAKGSSNGYIIVQKQQSDGSFIQQGDASEFIAPESKYDVKLLSSVGLNKSKWKIELYSGGSQSNGKVTGGTLKTTSKDGDPTGCH